MKLHHALPLLLSTLTVLSFANQEGSPRTRGTARGAQEQGTTRTAATEDDERAREFPGATRDTTLDVFGRRRDSAEAQSPQEMLVGGWQLKSMKLRKSPSTSQGVSGLLVISENFLSLELHGTGDPTSRLNGLAFHMSLGGEYVLDPEGRLTLTTMIGSFQDSNSEGLAWERTGQPREFKAAFTERQLLLSWGGNSNQLIFTRRTPRMTGRSDIFGRTIAPSADAPSLSTDIFGRTVPGETGETGGATDIFGRRIPGSGDESTDPKAGAAKPRGSLRR